MGTELLKRMVTGLAPVVALSVLLLVSLYLMSEATDNSAKFDRQYATLLIINVTGLVVLVIAIGINLYRLVRNYRRKAAGSRLTSRILVMFVVISVIPVSIVYYFSLEFLHRGIDSWFDVRIEKALDDALELSRAALDSRMREMLKNTEQMAQEVSGASDDVAALMLNDLRSRTDASELTLLSEGQVVVSSGSEVSKLVPNRPDESILSYVRETGRYVGLDPIGDSGLHVRVIVRVASPDPFVGTRVLQALFPVAERHNRLASNVQAAYAKYDELVYLRKPLKYSFTLTLSLVLLLTLLTAVWAAFVSARRLVAPVRDLAEGTRAVAEGNYNARLPQTSHDELGFLVQSFNEMTHKIGLARDEVKRSQLEAEDQRAYIEAVLGRLSSGVFALDLDGRLRTINDAAGDILGLDTRGWTDKPLEEIAGQSAALRQFVDAISEHLDEGEEWREEVTLFGAAGRQVLMCRGAPLPGVDEEHGGNVIVFDDITTLVQAQRDAAWGEVARRLAHEIKNPLTPIQLSAERLRHKLLTGMDPKEAEVLDRATHTIVQQVELMKEMVNAFSEYARAPKIEFRWLDLNNIVNEVLELYRGDGSGVRLDIELDRSLPQVEADDGRIRQVLHNLLRNAIEAMEGVEEPRITVSTRCMEQANCRYVELRVRDRGPGISPEMLGHLFEPYVSTKPKGSGLGLAIVKKIIEEHGGMLWAENLEEGGACIIIRLPVPEAATQRASARGGKRHRKLSARKAKEKNNAAA